MNEDKLFCTEHGDFVSEGSFHVCASCFDELKKEVGRLREEKQKRIEEEQKLEKIKEELLTIEVLSGEAYYMSVQQEFRKFKEKIANIIRG